MKKFKIVIIILTLVILTSCILIKLITLKTSYSDGEKVSADGRTENNQLLLNGFGVFSEKYSGKLKTSQISEYFQKNIKEDLPNLYKEVKKYNEAKLKEYYEKNITYIKSNFGITNFEDFKKFSMKVQNINTNLEKWYKININKESFVDNSDLNGYSYVEYNVEYEDNSILNFSAYITQRKENKPIIIYNILEN